MNHPHVDGSIQRLRMKRFAMAAGTYMLLIVLMWVAYGAGYYRADFFDVWLVSVSVMMSQAALSLVFFSGFNQRFRDSSLTEFQVLMGLGWETFLLYHLDSARGTFLVLYVLVLLFGLFHLPPKIFTRCAVVALLGFTALNLWDAHQGQLSDPGLASLQTSALFIVLGWLCLYARFVQGSRQRMHQHRITLQAHQETLRGMMFQLEELASTDELTNLYNRRHFLRLATRELESMEGSYTAGLALIDLDHFKRVNDVYGHATGDRVLQVFASAASQCLRADDILARYGGEEFVLLIPRCTRAQLIECCERVRLAFEQTDIPELSGLQLSLSVGMTVIERGDDMDRALHRADQALYRAKHHGRNRCYGAWDHVDA
ncbi:GGDEF domain-containing protein [Pseudomonas sp. GD03842]|uniref:GGDEF domain-containing protein n=1 Tax=unclassified Pseudomonas TaxID=196821 RepID=UPI000D3B1E53|nr:MULTISPECIES: GGDEF domain-containing protein [unclassified Pseudomonas]MDH0746405.1 GGDEF domain-containing protein [Pseudomonas sp. GD03842]RAU47055.1 GGDEF domain-containing protein [Pseudomonas sp. RIT 409]RAU54672.1 GGDEF domain-containing protein [Pseudomonas sp. RIT 412]